MKIKRNGQYLNENYVILDSEYDENSQSQVYEVLSTGFYRRNQKYYDEDDDYMVEFFHIGQEGTLHTHSFNATKHCGDIFNFVRFEYFKIDLRKTAPKFAVFI